MKAMMMAALAATILMSGGVAAFAQGQGQGPGQGQGAGSGMAQGQGPANRAARHEAMMKVLDADGDGKVTLEEFQNAPRGNSKQSAETVKQRRAANFKRFDRNGDGVLSPDEMPSKRP